MSSGSLDRPWLDEKKRQVAVKTGNLLIITSIEEEIYKFISGFSEK